MLELLKIFGICGLFIYMINFGQLVLSVLFDKEFWKELLE
jgi:hypothetical protein